MNRRVYLAGPMRGYPDLNKPAFVEAARMLRALGHLVVSPVEVCELVGLAPEEGPEVYLLTDLKAMLHYPCNAIALLPGWEQSVGARCEAAIARTLGFTFLDALTGEPLMPPDRIEITGGYELAVAI